LHIQTCRNFIMAAVKEDVLKWLLDSDPAICWQVLQDLIDAPPAEVAAERASVAKKGWGATLLSVRDEDGQWAGGACFPKNFKPDGTGQPWTPTMPTLCLLRKFGVEPSDPTMAETTRLVRENCKWEHAGQPFFDGEVEPCINGNTVSIGSYFGHNVGGIVERLIGEQLEDGGWNCEAENGSIRSSFNTTICVLEGLLEYERSSQATSAAVDKTKLRQVRERAQEYLLMRKLFRRASTGEVINPDFLKPAFLHWWHYDILRALDYFRAVGGFPDPRLAEAVELIRSKQLEDGSWPLEKVYDGVVHLQIDEGANKPSRWNTLRALRVLRWYDHQS
jgi:hypothetical protein